MLDSTCRLLDLMESSGDLGVPELVNQSGLLCEFPVNELPDLMNAVASIKSNASATVLGKMKRSII